MSAAELFDRRATDHVMRVDGRRVHYRQWGPANASPLVLIHGYPGHTHTWDGFAEAMRDGHRVIALDLAGHGESDWADTYSFTGWVSDIHALVLELGLSRFTMAGHSLGSTTGFCFADTHPAMLDRLIAVDGLPPGSWEPTTPNAGAVPAMFSTLDECATFLGIDVDDLPAGIEDGRLYGLKPDGRGGFVWRHDLRVRDALLRELRFNPQRWQSAAARTRVPITYLRCGRTHVGSYEDTAAILHHYRTCNLIDIPNVEHGLPTQHPEILASVVSRILR